MTVYLNAFFFFFYDLKERS